MTKLYAPLGQSVIGHQVGEKLCEITEAAAVAVGPWIGQGDKISADQAAVDAFHRGLEDNYIFTSHVVIGEGDKDEAPMLPHGARLGQSEDRYFDLAIDPIDNTTATASAKDGGIAVAALGGFGDFLPWADIHYMKKLVVGPGVRCLLENGDVQIDGSPKENIQRVVALTGKPPHEFTVAVLDRPRNRAILEAGEQLGVRVLKLSGGDIIPAILAASADHDGVDMLYSSGGAPEGVITAAAVAALGGNMQAMWDPRTNDETSRALRREELNKVLRLPDLVGHSELHFAMTAITDYKQLLTGCRPTDEGGWQTGTTVYLQRTV